MSLFRKFTDSSRELADVRSMTACAMMLALRVVLGMFANFSLAFIPLPVVKIGFTFIPMLITAYLCGPVCAGLVGGLGDVISYMLAPTGAGLIPGITACYVLEGIIYGVCLYQTDLKLRNLIIAKVSALALCTLSLNSLMLKLFYFTETPLYQIVLYRSIVLVPFAVIEIAVMMLLRKALFMIEDTML